MWARRRWLWRLQREVGQGMPSGTAGGNGKSASGRWRPTAKRISAVDGVLRRCLPGPGGTGGRDYRRRIGMESICGIILVQINSAVLSVAGKKKAESLR